MEGLTGGGAKNSMEIPTFTKEDIIKEGWLDKQSKFMKTWRKRYIVLCKTHMLTYKKNDGNYSAPTECIPITIGCTVKNAADELKITDSFKV